MSPIVPSRLGSSRSEIRDGIQDPQVRTDDAESLVTDYSVLAALGRVSKLGSANGNRTCQEPVQYGSLGSIYIILRRVRTAAYPVERTLLTTGALAALMDSSYQGHRRLETPHLNVSYRAPKESLFSRGPVPAADRQTHS